MRLLVFASGIKITECIWRHIRVIYVVTKGLILRKAGGGKRFAMFRGTQQRQSSGEVISD